MPDVRQVNVDLPIDLVEELKAYAAANRQILRLAVEDLIRAGLSSGRPTPVKSKTRSIPKRKSKVSAGGRNGPRSPLATEVQS